MIIIIIIINNNNNNNNSYNDCNKLIIIKDNHNNNDDENNAQNKDKTFKLQSLFKRKFLTTINAIKTFTGEKLNNNTYLLHPNYEETTLSNMQSKHQVH